MRLQSLLAATMVAALSSASSPAYAQDEALSAKVRELTRATAWELADEISVGFTTHHPQGMVRIGDMLFVSSVEIITPTSRYDTLQDGYDRDTGEGRGWLFQIDSEGNLVDEVELGEGDIYHPGGIDYDGEHIWVPVAEYRPNSASIVYRVDPETMQAEEMFRFRDHLGGIVHDVDNGSLHAVSWGSRRFYGWDLSELPDIELSDAVPTDLATPNPSHYIDYQDCHYIGGNEMLCSGLNNYTPPDDAPTFRLGGFEIVNLLDNRPVHQVPIELWSPSGLPMTQNPFWVETTDDGLRAYFMPDDDDSTLFVYEATLP